MQAVQPDAVGLLRAWGKLGRLIRLPLLLSAVREFRRMAADKACFPIQAAAPGLEQALRLVASCSMPSPCSAATRSHGYDAPFNFSSARGSN